MMDHMSATAAPQAIMPSMVPTSVNSASNMTNLYSHGNPGSSSHGGKGTSNHCGQEQPGGLSMSDDSETPISSPDEPNYKIQPVTMPQSPSSFKRELMDTSGSYQ